MSLRLEPRFLNRDFSDAVTFPDVRLEIQRYSHHAIGGPQIATMTAYGSELMLWELLEWLRSPVEILDEYNDKVWWGFVQEITVRIGAIEVGVSLATMFNNVAVAYSHVDPGSEEAGTRATTAWAQDDDSVAAYGTKELLVSLAEGTLAAAESMRDSILDLYKYPIPVVRSTPGKGSLSATLTCRGWWDTLGWSYYANTDTDSVETTQQIADIVSAEGQFLEGCDIVDASGIDSSEYRDGDSLALAIVADLLKGGTSSDKRLLARVTRDRILQVYEEPDSGDEELFLGPDGRLMDEWDSQSVAHTCPVGQWCGLKDVIPPTLDTTKLADPTSFFIERSEFDPQSQSWTPEPRGIPSPWEISQLNQG